MSRGLFVIKSVAVAAFAFHFGISAFIACWRINCFHIQMLRRRQHFFFNMLTATVALFIAQPIFGSCRIFVYYPIGNAITSVFRFHSAAYRTLANIYRMHRTRIQINFLPFAPCVCKFFSFFILSCTADGAFAHFFAGIQAGCRPRSTPFSE